MNYKNIILSIGIIVCGGAVVHSTSIGDTVYFPLHVESASIENDEVSNELYRLKISAPSWLVFDVKSGAIIDGEYTTTIRPIASITKLFTAVTALTSDMIDTKVFITHDIVHTEGTAGKLLYGDTMTIHELMYPMLIESSNDAAEAIRQHLGTTLFKNTINTIITDAHLSHTQIYDASGLSPHNVSSAEDMAKWFMYLKNTYPHVLDITQVKIYKGSQNGYINNNPGIHISGFQGGKHGYLDEAGYTFVGEYINSQNKHIGIVLLGSHDISSDIQNIIAYSESLDNVSAIITP